MCPEEIFFFSFFLEPSTQTLTLIYSSRLNWPLGRVITVPVIFQAISEWRCPHFLVVLTDATTTTHLVKVLCDVQVDRIVVRISFVSQLFSAFHFLVHSGLCFLASCWLGGTVRLLLPSEK